MELRQLRTFRMVATTSSFTQAAVVLNYAQSSVTAQIQALEKELEVSLFDRLGRGVQLTDAGRRLLRYADKILSLAEEAQSVVSENGQLEGAISVGAPETVCTYRLPAILRKFRDRYPSAKLSFRLMADADLYQGVRDGALDVAFLLQEPIKSNSLIVETLVEEPALVISAIDHPLAQLSLVRPSDLEGETVLLTERGCGYRHLFERTLARDGVYSVVKLELTSVEAIKQLAIAGLGIAFLPRVAVAGEIAQGQISSLKWGGTFQVYTQMVWHKDKWLSRPLEEFLNMSRQMLRGKRSSAH
jgi:DNA-binding transcriptional LysR family regulator